MSPQKLFIFCSQEKDEEESTTDICYQEDEDTLAASFSAWRYPLVVRLTLILVYTQFVVYHLMSADAHNTWLLKLPLLNGLSLTRTVQIILVNGSYLWYLRAAEETSD